MGRTEDLVQGCHGRRGRPPGQRWEDADLHDSGTGVEARLAGGAGGGAGGSLLTLCLFVTLTRSFHLSGPAFTNRESRRVGGGKTFGGRVLTLF